MNTFSFPTKVYNVPELAQLAAQQGLKHEYYEKDLAYVADKMPGLIADFRSVIAALIRTLNGAQKIEHTTSGNGGAIKFLDSELRYAFGSNDVEFVLENPKIERCPVKFFARQVDIVPKPGQQNVTVVWVKNKKETGEVQITDLATQAIGWLIEKSDPVL